MRCHVAFSRAVSRPLLSCRSYTPFRFTKEHEWVEYEEGKKKMRMGITNYAQEALGDVVFVDLPAVGASFQQGQSAGAVESVKAASDVYMPVGGKILDVNKKLTDEPGLVNTSALKDGWFFSFEASSLPELNKLMDQAAYDAYLKTL